MATVRGAPTATVRSGMLERQIVVMPAPSIVDATSPTDQLQRGHMGTKSTRSTWSSWSSRIMAGVDSSNKTVGSRL